MWSRESDDIEREAECGYAEILEMYTASYRLQKLPYYMAHTPRNAHWLLALRCRAGASTGTGAAGGGSNCRQGAEERLTGTGDVAMRLKRRSRAALL
jgi:hypothetical protein